MLGTSFDIAVCIILVVSSILLFTGNGKPVLNLFRGKANKGKPFPYEEKKLSICMGILCLVLLAAELVIIFLSKVSPIPVLIAMAVVVAAFVIVIIYLRKHAKVEVEPDRTISNKIKNLSRKK